VPLSEICLGIRGEMEFARTAVDTCTPTIEFLERGHFLDVLDEYAEDAARGSGRFVLLAGEAGVGKTSLLEAFRGRRPELRWLWGACDGSFTPRPLGPLYEIATGIGGGLAQLCTDGADRRELFGAFLDELNGDAKTVVVIEDLHWADDATLDWLRHLARRIAGVPAMVIVSYRDDEPATDNPLPRVIGQIVTHRGTRRISLPTLTVDAVRQLAARTDADADELYRVTGGVPYYVEEVLCARPGEVPATVADIVTTRTSRLSANARRLLAAAAVIARPAEPQLLATVASVDASALDECLESGALIGGPANYHFRHEITRMAVERTILAHSRSQLHAAAISELERSTPADHARLAHHAESAGDSGKAFHYARIAAYTAFAMRSNREAVAQFRRALRFADGAGAEVRAALREGLATALALVDHWEESTVERREALALRRQLGDPAKISLNLRWLSRCLWRMCRGEEGDRAAREAFTVMASAAPCAERAWAYAIHAETLVSGPALPEGLKRAEEALQQAEALDCVEVMAYTLNTMGMFRFAMGQDGFADIKRSIDIAHKHGLDEHEARGYANIYQAAVDRFRLADHEHAFLQGTAFCRDNDMRTYGVCIRGSRAMALLWMGRFSEAAALAADTLRETISPVNRLHLLIALAAARVRMGDLDAAALLDEAWPLAVDVGERQWQLSLAWIWAEAAWLQGDPNSLDPRVTAVYEASTADDPWLVAGLAVRLDRIGRLTRRPGNPPEPYAYELDGDYPAAADWWQSAGCPFDEAVLLARSGDHSALRCALEIFASLDTPPATAYVRRRMRAAGHSVIPRGPRAATRADPNGLTPREAEVLALLREGLSNAAISRRMFISERTVHHHVSAVLAKLGVRSRGDVARAHHIGTPARK
jgi:DNA-binding CsgD family transcriptional regulator